MTQPAATKPAPARPAELVYPVYRFSGFFRREYLIFASSSRKALEFAIAYNQSGLSQNGSYLAESRPLPAGQRANRFRGWDLDFEYGYHTATHDGYDASWEGEEDGWVDNGLRLSERDLPALLVEISEHEATEASDRVT